MGTFVCFLYTLPTQFMTSELRMNQVRIGCKRLT
jgi:hypothetical protein